MFYTRNCGEKQQQAEPETMLIEGNLGCFFKNTVAMLLFFLKNRMTSINCFVTFAYVAGCCVGGERMRRPKYDAR